MAQLQGLFDLILQLSTFVLSDTQKKSPQYLRYSHLDIKGTYIDTTTKIFV